MTTWTTGWVIKISRFYLVDSFINDNYEGKVIVEEFGKEFALKNSV